MSEQISEAARQEVYARIDRRFDAFVEDLRAYARAYRRSAPGARPKPKAPRRPWPCSGVTGSRLA